MECSWKYGSYHPESCRKRAKASWKCCCWETPVLVVPVPAAADAATEAAALAFLVDIHTEDVAEQTAPLVRRLAAVVGCSSFGESKAVSERSLEEVVLVSSSVPSNSIDCWCFH